MHLGTKAGRLSGRRLGYSQIVNPVYLRTKGTITRASLLQHWFKNIVSNVVLSLRPEPYVDRRGRLHGNILGFRDLLLEGCPARTRGMAVTGPSDDTRQFHRPASSRRAQR